MTSRTIINQTLAILTGASKSTIDRNGVELKNAGIIKSKGRGRNAVVMGAGDAANIIIALLGSQNPKEAPRAVKEYGPLIDIDGGSDETFFSVLSGLLTDGADDVDYVSINRSYPSVEIKFEDGHSQFFEDDTNADYDPLNFAFEVEAKISGKVTTHICNLIWGEANCG